MMTIKNLGNYCEIPVPWGYVDNILLKKIDKRARSSSKSFSNSKSNVVVVVVDDDVVVG